MNGNHVAHQLTADIDLPELVPLDQHWKSAREAQAQRQQETWERAQKQWFKSVPPLYNNPEPEPEKEMLTPLRVLIGCGAFLAVCVAGFSTLLYFLGDRNGHIPVLQVRVSTPSPNGQRTHPVGMGCAFVGD